MIDPNLLRDNPFETLCARLTALRGEEPESDFPVRSIQTLRDAGVWRHSVDPRYGGIREGVHPQLEAYHAIGRANLALALILTQHDAACELLGDSDADDLAATVLPKCATGEMMLTVGISQLTTSRRRGPIAMRATETADGFRLKGLMPWVTAAEKADAIVVGAALEDGRQILGLMPTDTDGLSIDPPMELLALRASYTTEARCEDVLIPKSHIVRGPVENALSRRSTIKPLTVSVVGLGVARGLLDGVLSRAEAIPDCADVIARTIEPAYDEVEHLMLDATSKLSDPTEEVSGAAVRSAVNALVARLAATLLTAAKGSGYMLEHPAQRLVREALFFLVWSAPGAVQRQTLENLWDSP